MKKIILLFIMVSSFFNKAFAQKDTTPSNFTYEFHQNTIFAQNSPTFPLIYGMIYLDTKSRFGGWAFTYFEPSVCQILGGPKFSLIKTNEVQSEFGIGIGYDFFQTGTEPTYGGYFWFTNNKYDLYGYTEQNQNQFLWWNQFYLQRHIGKCAIGPGYQTNVGYGLKISYILKRWEFYTQPSLESSKEQKILFGIRFHN